jgi:hypothetical protein
MNTNSDIYVGFDKMSLQTTHCSLLQRYDLDHRREFSQIPNDFNLCINTL